MNKKTDLGQFNTKKDVWLKPQVLEFIKNSGCSQVLDPFAGKGDLLNVATELGFVSTIGLDIDKKLGWKINDGLESVPYYKDTIVITNPPYFSKVSASTKKSEAVDKYLAGSPLTDIYQRAIGNVLENYEKSVFIIPETYLLTKFYKDDLKHITILEDNPFEDTDCPVCVACFNSKRLFSVIGSSFDIYKNDKFLFTSDELRYITGKYFTKELLNVKFNVSDGNIGLRGVDGVKKNDRIRFCLPEELNYDKDIKHSSRAITIINVELRDDRVFDVKKLIDESNKCLEEFRESTFDVVLAPFKNNNKAGVRRRRLDFGYARCILNKAMINLKEKQMKESVEKTPINLMDEQ